MMLSGSIWGRRLSSLVQLLEDCMMVLSLSLDLDIEQACQLEATMRKIALFMYSKIEKGRVRCVKSWSA